METCKQLVNSFVSYVTDYLFLIGLLLANLGSVHVCVLRLGSNKRFLEQTDSKVHTRSPVNSVNPKSDDSTARSEKCLGKINSTASYTRIDGTVLYNTIKSIVTYKLFKSFYFDKTIHIFCTDSIIDPYFVDKIIRATAKCAQADRHVLSIPKQSETTDKAAGIDAWYRNHKSESTYTKVDNHVLYQTIKLIATDTSFCRNNLIKTNKSCVTDSTTDPYVQYKVFMSKLTDAKLYRTVASSTKVDCNGLIKSNKPARTITYTITDNATDTKTVTITDIITDSATDTKTVTITDTINDNATDTKTVTLTDIITDSATDTKTVTITDTITDMATDTKTVTITDTKTDNATVTITDTITDSATDTKTVTITDTITDNATDTKTVNITDTKIQTKTNTETVTATDTITDTNALSQPKKLKCKDINSNTRVLCPTERSEFINTKADADILPQNKKLEYNGIETDIFDVLPKNKTSGSKDIIPDIIVVSKNKNSKSKDIKNKRKSATDTSNKSKTSGSKATKANVCVSSKKKISETTTTTTDSNEWTVVSVHCRHYFSSTETDSRVLPKTITSQDTNSRVLPKTITAQETDSRVLPKTITARETDTKKDRNGWILVSRRKRKAIKLDNDDLLEIMKSEEAYTKVDDNIFSEIYKDTNTKLELYEFEDNDRPLVDAEVHNVKSATTTSYAAVVKQSTTGQKVTTSACNWVRISPANSISACPATDEPDCTASATVSPETQQPLAWGTTIVSSRYVRSNRDTILSRSKKKYIINGMSTRNYINYKKQPPHKKINLHKKTLPQAVESFYRFYNRQLQYYEENGYRDQDRYIFVVTGHCRNRKDKTAKIRPEIEFILHEEQVSHFWYNRGGEVRVDLDSGQQSDHRWCRKVIYCNYTRDDDF